MPSVVRGRRTVGAIGIVVLVVASITALAAVRRDTPGRVQSEQKGGERAFFVSVLDKEGGSVRSLAPADFIVREDGVVREVLRAERATEPVSFVVLVDTSQAASPYIPDMRLALTAFVKTMGGRNPMAIIGLGERPTVLAEYTLDPDALQKGVERIFAANGSGSYALQAVEEAVKLLAKQDVRRADILLITGGGPEFSERTYDEYLPRLRESAARLDVMSFDIRPPNMSDFGQRNREQFIDAATRATGGNRFSLLSSMALDSALAKLADELGNQYRVTYFRPERLIPPQKVEVSVRQPGLTVRATPVKVKQG